MIVYLVVLVVEGLLIGALARLALPGKDPFTLWQTLAIGLAGVLVSGLLYYALTDGQARGGGFFAAFCVAFAIVYLVRRRRGGDLTHPDGRRS